MTSIKWAYGVTTCSQRKDTLLPRTLASLRAAGFGAPRLFVDGDSDVSNWIHLVGLENLTLRNPKIRAFGNWILALYELFIRDAQADRYAIFQDDLVTYPHLREYLNACEYPGRGYWNLYTFPENQDRCPEGLTGWYPSNQKGRGALGLVLNRETTMTLLCHDHMVKRPLDPDRGWRAIDGGIVTSLTKSGWTEYVHNPSLVQHTGGDHSIIAIEEHLYHVSIGRSTLEAKENYGRPSRWQAVSFRGEDFDALNLVSAKAFQVARQDQPAASQIAVEEIERIKSALQADRERLKGAVDDAERMRLERWISIYRERLLEQERIIGEEESDIKRGTP